METVYQPRRAHAATAVPRATTGHHANDPLNSAVTLSIAVPMYNESGNVGALVDAVLQTVGTLDTTAELILVDDGSRDSTWREICAVTAEHPTVRGIKLARNFGHQSALLAGLRFASGTAVVSMDGDLQHPPELIPDLLAAWQDGYKVVNTRRIDAQSTGWFKRTTSRLFYRGFSALSGIEMEAGSSDFRLIDRQALDALLRFDGAGRFLRGATEWMGYPATTIPYQANDRLAGSSTYSLGKMFAFATSAVVSFSTKPLKFGIWLGLLTSTLAFLELIYVLIQAFRGDVVSGWASTVGILSFLFGILFIILGIIGLYIAQIHETLQNRPPFLVDEVVNFESETARSQKPGF